VLRFSSFSPKLKDTDQKQFKTASEVMFITRLQRIKTHTHTHTHTQREREREREGRKRLQCSRTQSRYFYAQAHKQKTSNQTELQRKMFDTEHLIYNQRCSQYKSDRDSL